jgi:hypothetical protein
MCDITKDEKYIKEMGTRATMRDYIGSKKY